MTQYFETPCPHCRHNLRVRVEYIGQWVSCRHCNREFMPRPHADTPPPVLTSESSVRAELEAVRGDCDRLRRLISNLRSLLAEANGQAELRVDHDHQGRAAGAASGNGSGRAATDSRAFGGLSIPGYEIVGTLREGAMGRVYRARQTSLDRIVAIKVLDAALATQPDYRMRFEREARLSSRLAHPNLIMTIDAGEAGNHPYFVMEYVEGTTVEDELARRPHFDEIEALRIALEVAEALAYLHSHGLMHRDIKPANVILTREGRVKLADLGLARSTADAELAATEHGKAIGTPEYISPEQVSGEFEPDIRSDLYSLGATLYRMVTGRVPYAGETSREVMRKHADREVALVPPIEITPSLSENANRLILKLLSRDRIHRYRNPDELIVDLRQHLAEAISHGADTNSSGTTAAR